MTTTSLTVHGLSSIPASSASALGETGAPITLEQIQTEHTLSYDPRFISPSTDLRLGYLLADRVTSLDQPWRCRFLKLIAQRAGATSDCTRCPSRTQLAIWLSDQQLSRLIRQMLHTWTHER